MELLLGIIIGVVATKVARYVFWLFAFTFLSLGQTIRDLPRRLFWLFAFTFLSLGQTIRDLPRRLTGGSL